MYPKINLKTSVYKFHLKERSHNQNLIAFLTKRYFHQEEKKSRIKVKKEREIICIVEEREKKKMKLTQTEYE